MHRAHARNKMKMTEQMAIAMALPGFNDLRHLVIPIFLLMDHFLYQFSTFSEKKMWTRSLIFLQNAPASSFPF